MKKAMVATTPRTRKMTEPMIRPDYFDMIISEVDKFIEFK
jgi:hypothetical protein